MGCSRVGGGLGVGVGGCGAVLLASALVRGWQGTSSSSSQSGPMSGAGSGGGPSVFWLAGIPPPGAVCPVGALCLKGSRWGGLLTNNFQSVSVWEIHSRVYRGVNQFEVISGQIFNNSIFLFYLAKILQNRTILVFYYNFSVF